MSSVYVRLQKYEFSPGNIISGEAICYFKSPKEFRKIRIRLQGREHTSWTKQETYYDSSQKKHNSRTVHYSGDNTFLEQDDIVRDQDTLLSGEHVFPISFQLPDDIPSSFQCRYGYIAYTIKLTVDIPFKFDLEDTKDIKIVAPVKLHDIALKMIRGCELEDEKTICCWCCAGGNMEMQVSLPCKAFAVGYPGFVKVYILNMSNVNVDDLTVNIGQVLRFKATDPGSDYKYDSEKIAVSHNSGVGAHADKTYNLELKIPSSSVVPNFTRCQLFRCEHELKVTAGISGCHKNLEVSTDVAACHEHPNMHPLHQEHQTQSNAMQNKKSSSWETIGAEEYAGEAPLISQPMPMSMPMCPESGPMLMPMPGHANPAPNFGFFNPSAPPPPNAPSAPPKIDFGDNSRIGQPSIIEPPPSYDELARQHVLQMRQN
ncbi:unnamed protein product [Ceutorhynchus assimilis]|uniref:Arrestin C-terminal-like domain-containing protein n=1 Tax=Ceutorhynchus assimilis TaxID=467358 RepID=A0A9N9QJA2_9CUCU|nr:unnamed protein product [Ceutorhynchus assimilis]